MLFVLLAFSSYAQEKESTEIHKTRSSATINGLKYYLHTVEKGQTLFAIAKKYNVSVDQIKKLNKLKSTSIKKGQVLVISESNSGKETMAGKSDEVKIHDEAIQPIEKLPKPEKIETEKVTSVSVEKAEPECEYSGYFSDRDRDDSAAQLGH